MKRHHTHNMPYIYADVCDLLNGVSAPVELNPHERANLSDFLAESIRKTHVWGKFAGKAAQVGGFGRPLLPSAFAAD